MKSSSLFRSIVLGSLGGVLGCGSAPPATPAAPVSVKAKPVKNVSLAEVGLDASALDRTADPCEDFYQFACGSWIDKTPIPSDQPRWNRSFSEIQKRNEEDLKGILEVAAKPDAPKSDDDKKLGDYYASCTDEGAIESASLTPIRPLLDRIDALARPAKRGKGSNKAALEALVADLHRAGINAFFGITSGPDDKDATTMIAHVDQGGLGLPDRDYYLDAKFADVLEFYQGHVEAMLKLAGADDAAAKLGAVQVLATERKLAEISKTVVERRDPQGMYNRIDREGLTKRSKQFDYAVYLDTLVNRADNAAFKLRSFSKINVTSVAFFEKLNDVVAGLGPEELGNYLRWHVLHEMAAALPKAFDAEHFKFVQKITGQKEQKPRWKRCIASVDGSLGELLGKAYVAKRFLPESKDDVRSMLRGIREALDRRLPALAWMDDATRAQAKVKLSKMEELVGYPDRWREYPFAIERGSYASNVMRANSHEFERRLSKIETPVDRGEWYMPPQVVNAYYDPNKNQMVFPAGILQPPFYSPKASLAVNMGAMGMVVGHELTHGFDDQGSQYDGDGNLKSWWEPAVRKNFEDRAGCIEQQYGEYEVLPGVKQNGKLTLGENIADNAGLMLAYEAMLAMRADSSEELVAEGFNERQQLFLSLGQVWCSKATDALTKLRAATDPHSHAKWRVNGSVRNLPSFAEAFQCAEGTPMRPKNACAVW